MHYASDSYPFLDDFLIILLSVDGLFEVLSADMPGHFEIRPSVLDPVHKPLHNPRHSTLTLRELKQYKPKLY